MNKMAMFFEGRTELEFSSKLIREIAGRTAVTIETRRLRGATTHERSSKLITTIQAGAARDGSEHFFLLFDCGGDTAAKTRMMTEYENLARSGYSRIICQRDVAPDFTLAEVPKLERSLPMFVRTKPIVVVFVLSIMEIEAWFLAEHTHFPRIHPAITCGAIAAALGFSPEVDDMQTRPLPANDLNRCYLLAGKEYKKAGSQSTIDALDYVTVYVETSERIPYLKRLCKEISEFLGV
jgi:hypothetical protein